MLLTQYLNDLHDSYNCLRIKPFSLYDTLLPYLCLFFIIKVEANGMCDILRNPESSGKVYATV